VGGELLAVAPQQRVGGEADVVLGIFAKASARPVPRRLSTLSGGEALGLALPVEHQRGGQHHQRGLGEAAGVLFGEQVGEGLGGLAEAHVVGEDAAEAVLAQVLQPGQAFELVGAQLEAKPAGAATGRSGRRRGCVRSSRRGRRLALPAVAEGVGQARASKRDSLRLAEGLSKRSTSVRARA
jgi:hypothetical protein